MLADSLLENRVLKFVSEKIVSRPYKRMVEAALAADLCSQAASLSDDETCEVDTAVSRGRSQ